MERRWMLSLLLLIGIVGYFTVPSVAGYIINPGGGNGLLNKISNLTASSVNPVMNRAGSGATNIIQAPGQIMEGYRSAGNNDHQADKLNGNPKK